MVNKNYKTSFPAGQDLPSPPDTVVIGM